MPCPYIYGRTRGRWTRAGAGMSHPIQVVAECRIASRLAPPRDPISQGVCVEGANPLARGSSFSPLDEESGELLPGPRLRCGVGLG